MLRGARADAANFNNRAVHTQQPDQAEDCVTMCVGQDPSFPTWHIVQKLVISCPNHADEFACIVCVGMWWRSSE